jgi:hypothetical protein
MPTTNPPQLQTEDIYATSNLQKFIIGKGITCADRIYGNDGVELPLDK